MDKSLKSPDLHAYPAVIEIDDDEGAVYSIFPDIDNCFSNGHDIPTAIESAREALGNVLYWMEKQGYPLPNPSDIRTVKTQPNEFTSIISVDMAEIRRTWDNRSVNRNVTLPAWLDSLTRENDINCSMLLQNALKRTLKEKGKRNKTKNIMPTFA